MIHVGDMLQKEEEKKEEAIYPVVLQVECF